MFGPALCSPSRGIGALTDLTTQGFQRERQPAPYKSMLCENLRKFEMVVLPIHCVGA